MKASIYEDKGANTIFVSATLKVDIILHAGRIYPAGSTFKFRARALGEHACWYEYIIPGVSSGVVKIKNSIFLKLSAFGRQVKRSRELQKANHILSTKDKIISFQ
jgi:hypothetical protein